MSAPAPDLQALLAPRSIALVGASRSNPCASRLLSNVAGGGLRLILQCANAIAELEQTKADALKPSGDAGAARGQSDCTSA